MPKLRTVLLVAVVVILLIGGLFIYQAYVRLFTAPGDSPTGEYVFTVKYGDTIQSIAKQLEADRVIHSAELFKINEALQPLQDLQVGEYTLEVPADPANLIKQINAQSEILRLANLQADKRPSVTVTLREGLGIDDYATVLADKGVIRDVESFKQYALQPTNFDRQKYPFLPQPLDCEYGDIRTCAKYYPEGYLYPDTYEFFLESAPGEVYNKMLNNFNTKVWSKVESQVKDKRADFARIVILASVLEKETGRTKGIKPEQLEEVNTERKNMAQVFYNRTNLGMKWQSDVTIEYGTGRKVCQQTFKVPNCFLLDDPIARHKYNTYLHPGYPIGPVSNPQYYNIEAALNPIANDYLYFVSDVIGRKYFSSSEADFQASIRKVNQINKDLGM